MIWVAWRQFRTQALVTLGLLAAFTSLVLVTGLHLRDVYSSLGGAHCHARSHDCSALGLHEKALADLLGPALLAIPALLGMFWGAPLVARELESGTYRLAWTQSVTRRRWLSVRVALVGVAALAVAGLASWLVSWWFAPIDAVNLNRFNPSVFTERGVVAIGYAGLAFALGVTAGALTRRTLPAMAATLLGFAGARVAVTFWVRPYLLNPTKVLVPVTFGNGVGFVSSASGVSIAPNSSPIPNAWPLSAALVDRAHHAVSAAQLHDLLVRACPAIAAGLPQTTGGAPKGPKGPPTGAVLACEQRLSHHLQQLVTYQPPSHYWPLQALETGIFLAAAFALIGAAVWRVGRRAAHKPAVGEPHERTADRLSHLDRREPTITRCRRPPIRSSLVAVAALSLLVAACGGSSSTTAATTTTAATPSGALAYARCMRSHGVPNFPDPISSGGNNKRAVVSALEGFSNSQVQAAMTACMRVNGGSPGTGQGAAQSQAHPAALLAFAHCIRSHGFPTFPDPTSSGQVTPQMLANAGIELNQPAALQAGDACTSVTHGVITKAVVARFVAGQ